MRTKTDDKRAREHQRPKIGQVCTLHLLLSFKLSRVGNKWIVRGHLGLIWANWVKLPSRGCVINISVDRCLS